MKQDLKFWNIFFEVPYNYLYLNYMKPWISFKFNLSVSLLTFSLEKTSRFQSKFEGRKQFFFDLDASNWILKQWRIFQNFPCCKKIFARILQRADKFCRVFPCKMSEFSMFYKKKIGRMHACIFHVLSACLTRDLFDCLEQPVSKN